MEAKPWEFQCLALKFPCQAPPRKNFSEEDARHDGARHGYFCRVLL